MKCLSPIALKGHAGTVFDTHLSSSTYVPCGQCIACRLNYAKFWSIRMMQEMKHHDSACFATLTYDDEHLNDICEDFGQPVLVKSDIQKFWKRLRKERKVRYFVVVNMVIVLVVHIFMLLFMVYHLLKQI